MFPITGWDSFSSKILPAFALSFGSLATISRLMRTSMLDVLGQDYIKTAKSKGLSQRKIIWKHAVRNAIMPVITVIGPIAASVLTGAFVVENIFSIPGMGKFFVQSIQTQDYTMISGITLFYGTFLVLANLIVDLAYGFIDPRVKLTDARSDTMDRIDKARFEWVGANASEGGTITRPSTSYWKDAMKRLQK